MSESLFTFAKKALPTSFKRAIEPFLLAYRKRAYRKYLTRAPFSLPGKGVWLSYGNVLLREPGAVVYGGRVKLLALDQLYPERSDSFNILYMVSSALPPFAEELAQWAGGKGIKIVFNQNGVAYPAWADGYLQAKINGPMRRIIHMADYVFYQSKFCLECADKYLGPVDAPWEIAYNYVDTAIFTPRGAPAPDVWRLLSAGNNMRKYKVISALDTAAELKRRGRKVHLTIAGNLIWPGSADHHSETVEEIDKRGMGGQTTLRLSYTRIEAPSIFTDAHILLHTKYNDPCPNVPIEAMSCGLPVVGSNSGGMPELVEAGAGILVDVPKSWEKDHVPDISLMADAVEKIMSDRDTYSKNARQLAIKRFDKVDWLNQHKRVFESQLTQ